MKLRQRLSHIQQLFYAPKAESLIPHLIVLTAVLFGVHQASPLLRTGNSHGGDDSVQVAYVYELLKMFASGAHGWSYLYGIGEPIFLVRPPAFYFTVALAHLCTFGLLPAILTYKLVLILGFSLYPIAVYYLMSKLDYHPMACAMAALLALTPISTWGHTIHAYFTYGLTKQILAICLFPVALGKIYGAALKGESKGWAAFWMAAVFLNHPYMGFCLALVVGLLWLLSCLALSWNETKKITRKLCVISSLFLLLSAVYTVPHYTSSEIQREGQFGSISLHASFDFVVSTCAKTLNSYLRADIFDGGSGQSFGQELSGDYAWRINPGSGRLPVLTYASLLGCCFALLGLASFANAFLLFGFLASWVLFLGPDDVSLLHFLPFQNEFQYLHSVFQLELFAICLGGLGLYLGLHSFSALCLPKRWDSRRARIFLQLTILGPLIYSVYRERLEMAKRTIDVAQFEARQRNLAPASRATGLVRDFQEIITALREQPDTGRFYAAPFGNVAEKEAPYFNLAPYLTDKTDVMNSYAPFLLGQGNRLLAENFRSKFPRSYNLMELANVRYLLHHSANPDEFSALAAEMTPLVRNANWQLWRLRGDYGYFKLLKMRPILVFSARAEDWLALNKSWLELYQDKERSSELPALIRAEPSSIQNGRIVSAERYSAIFSLGTSREIANHTAAFSDFAAHGGLVLSPLALEGVRTTLVTDLRSIIMAVADQAHPPPGILEQTSEGREFYTLNTRLSRNTFAVFKMAYYRGWQAFIDGKKTDIACVSPGFIAFWVPAGEHRLMLRYGGHNHFWIGFLLSLGTMIAVIGASLRRKWQKH